MPWDVFVSHASEDKELVAKPLADALKSAGLSVWYDEFELSVGDSLRRSIDEGLSKSRYGIVILSKAFFAKEWPQKELDGLVQQEVAGISRILPIWYDVTAEDVRRYSPVLADRFASAWNDGLPKVLSDIVGVVSGSPSLEPEAHQEVVADSAIRNARSLVLLMTSAGYLLVDSRRVEAGAETRIELLPENPRETAFLQEVAARTSDQFGIAFGSTAQLVRVTEARQVFEAGQEIWVLVLSEIETDYGTAMEVSVEGHSADEIAEMRARRILLNEGVSSRRLRMRDDMLEMFVQGMNTPIKVPHSPLPGLYAEWKHDPATFVALARLAAVLWLRLSGAVEAVLHLEMRLEEDGLRVEFEGRRRRQYVNADPYVIQVRGVCPLS